MAHSTQLSFQPEMYSGQDFPRKADTTNQIQSSASAGSKQLSKWSSPSLRTSGNQTNKSPKLAFAAAIIAASLQFFALPGFAVESEQNLTQRNELSNADVERIVDELHILSEIKDAKNEYESISSTRFTITIVEIIGLFVSIGLGVWQLCLLLLSMPNIKKSLEKAENEKEKMSDSLSKFADNITKEVTELRKNIPDSSHS